MQHPKKEILITGGAGYLGAYLVQELLGRTDCRIKVYSRDELKHFDLKLRLGARAREVSYVIGDVRDTERLQEATKGVDVIIHAAAMKQVGTCEENPAECYKTNVQGTENVLQAAAKNGVEKVIFISTDKAVEPVSVYGNSKQAGERLVLKANQTGIKGSVVRFGNLIGSPGSIVDKIRKLGTGEPITLYHEDLTRFVDSLPGAFRLVTEQIYHDFGGAIMLPRLRSVFVRHLVRQVSPMARITYGGERGFEKIHEKLANQNELGRMVQKEAYYLVTEEPMTEDEALDTYGALPVRLQGYSSADVLMPQGEVVF